MPALYGTVDVYPFASAVALAHRFPYSPRPALQSYAAYTPRLSRMDAEHLQGAHAPDNILFEVAPIDGRFPALDDSLSLPELLTRYEARGGVAGRFLLLIRSSRPRTYSLTPIADLKGRMGQLMTLPLSSTGKPIWATVELRSTWRGSAAAMLFKPPVISMVVRERGGRVKSYRVLPELVGAGFMLSPVIEDPGDMLNLLQSGKGLPLQGNHVEAIAIGGDGIDWAFAPEFELKLWTIDIQER